MTLDERGRCCGRKPMVYKSPISTSTGQHRYCPRCDRAYDLHENEQMPNWAWGRSADGTWERKTCIAPRTVART